MSTASAGRPFTAGRPLPVRPQSSALERPDRRRPVRWLGPAVVAVAFGPFVMTAVGVAVAALRPAPQPAQNLLVAEPRFDLPVVSEPAPPEPVEPGEARPPLPGTHPRAEEPPPEPVPVPEPPPAAPACNRFGTAIDFVRSPAVARDRAAREQKLVMVLHLAGHFEDPGFT